MSLKSFRFVFSIISADCNAVKYFDMKAKVKKTFFFYQQSSDPDLVTEKNVYMYRAYLALKKFGVVRDEIGANSPQLLQPLKTLMGFIQSEGNPSKRYKWNWNHTYLLIQNRSPILNYNISLKKVGNRWRGWK